MAQIRIHDWRGEASSALLNQRWYEAFGNFILNGLDVVPGSSGMRVTVKAGAGLIAGLTFIETEDKEDVLTLAVGHSTYPRIDAVVAQYVRQETEPAPAVTYLVIQGTPAPNPVPPSVAANQLRLANIRVPAQATIITEEMIQRMPKLRDRIQALIPHGALTQRPQPFYIEGTIWARNTDPRTDPTCVVQVGDLWADTSTTPPSIYVWTGTGWSDLQEWENIKNKPTTFPVGPHPLSGTDPDTGIEVHTGKLPLSRVSGHTAFGPAAHQEAFAGGILRRP
jgi:hypothetical protein